MNFYGIQFLPKLSLHGAVHKSLKFGLYTAQYTNVDICAKLHINLCRAMHNIQNSEFMPIPVAINTMLPAMLDSRCARLLASSCANLHTPGTPNSRYSVYFSPGSKYTKLAVLQERLGRFTIRESETFKANRLDHLKSNRRHNQTTIAGVDIRWRIVIPGIYSIPWIVTGSRTIRSAHATTTTTPQKKPPESLLLIKSSLVANITFYLNKL